MQLSLIVNVSDLYHVTGNQSMYVDSYGKKDVSYVFRTGGVVLADNSAGNNIVVRELRTSETTSTEDGGESGLTIITLLSKPLIKTYFIFFFRTVFSAPHPLRISSQLTKTCMNYFVKILLASAQQCINDMTIKYCTFKRYSIIMHMK